MSNDEREALAREWRETFQGKPYLQDHDPLRDPPAREGVITPAIVRAWLKSRDLPYELDGFERGQVVLRPTAQHADDCPIRGVPIARGVCSRCGIPWRTPFGAADQLPPNPYEE